MSQKDLTKSESTSNVAPADNNDNDNNNCVVCFKSFQIYSIGECDHVCCFECSTRMRVLCRQNECPICRKDLSKVIFTMKLQPYHELDVQNRSGLYDKKYRICFSDLKIQKSFYELLDNSCPKCNKNHFATFAQLKEHVRKEHELYYCDICTDNLNIFSKERRCYTRQELALHRRKGDPDNTSHRGHPLCEYCDNRYLDNDELFRHLRRQHYFCHFCDADGANQFYANYDALRDHFRSEHYLCEDDECIHEKFTVVFRTEIDLKAHKATVHGKNLSRTLAKQTRTLEVEFTYTPRNRANNNTNGNQDGPQGRRSRHPQSSDNHQSEFETFRPETAFADKQRVIDAQNPEEFPSLGGSSTSVTFSRPANLSIRQSYGPGGLARTKENFPALSTGSHSVGITSNSSSSKPSTSVILKNSSTASKGKPGNDKMVIHLSNRPNVVKEKSRDKDFPALPGPGPSRNNRFLDFDDDIVPSTLPNSLVNVLSAKHRGLVDDYVSSGSNTTSKVNVLQKTDSSTQKVVKNEQVPSLNSFPSLGKSSSASNIGKGPQWLTTKPAQSNGMKDFTNKSKVAPAPFQNYETNFTTLTSTNIKLQNNKSNNNNNNKLVKNKNDQPKKDVGTSNKSEEKKDNVAKVDRNKKEVQNKNNNNNHINNEHKFEDQPSTSSLTNKFEKVKAAPYQQPEKLNNGNSVANGSPGNKITFSENSFPALGMEGNRKAMRPPPGFSNSNETSTAPPPGFHNVQLNSIARNTNKLTFTSSSGESFDIKPTQYTYVSPINSLARNEELFNKFKKLLKNDNMVIEEFRQISQMFRDGTYKALAYYEHCQFALKDKFEEIFPEMLVLLPDISKQQELYLVYSQQKEEPLKGNGKKKSKLKKLEVCATCKQVLLTQDLAAHVKTHLLENDFPKLSVEQDTSGNSAWKK